MRKDTKSRMEVQTLIKAAAYAEAELPHMLQELRSRFAGEISAAEMNSIVRTFMSFTESSERLKEHLGLRKQDRVEGAEVPLLAIISKNITLANFKALSPEERADLLDEMEDGEVKEAEVIENKPVVDGDPD